MDSSSDIISYLKEKFPQFKGNLLLVTHTTNKKEDWVLYADEHGIGHTNGLVKSSTWCLGGTYGNCWNDSMGSISADPQPTSFTEFDDILENTYPTCTFLQYKRLYNNLVSVDTSSEGDYYGGSTSYAWFQFSLPQFFKEIKEFIN